MKKADVIEKLKSEKVIAVIRSDNADSVYKTVEACVNGGIRAIEITYTIPNAGHIIEQLSGIYANQDILIGAGTVCDSATASNAILAGAKFIVSPTVDAGMVELCNRYRVVCAAGAFTPNEVKNALQLGADYIKIFPASLCTPAYLGVLHGPFPQAEFMVTGNMTFETLTSWLDGGASIIGVGGLITEPAKRQDYKKVCDNARMVYKTVHRTDN